MKYLYNANYLTFIVWIWGIISFIDGMYSKDWFKFIGGVVIIGSLYPFEIIHYEGKEKEN